MRQIHDIDAIILMATTLSAKRRPATLIEIVAAADLLQGFIPYVDKLDYALQRLADVGLICQLDGGFTLTAIGEQIMAQQPKRASTEKLLAGVKSDLAAYSPAGEYPPIQLTKAELGAAIRTHKAARKGFVKNMLMPKPKTDSHFKVEGRWRRVAAPR
jgi:hypothetical protein